MPTDWSQALEVERLADAGVVRQFELPLTGLPRLVGDLAEAAGQVRGEVRFLREGGRALADIDVQARVPLRCQRCLRTVWFEVEQQSQVVLVAEPQAADELDPAIEPLLAPGGRIALSELVEEELLLALPLVPRHENLAECDLRPLEAVEEEVQRPFAGLGELLKRGN
jgi:uncharacterized protein